MQLKDLKVKWIANIGQQSLIKRLYLKGRKRSKMLQPQINYTRIVQRFHNDEIIKYLISQIERVYNRAKPSITIDLKSMSIVYHHNANEQAINYWKEQLDNYVKAEYPELTASLDKK